MHRHLLFFMSHSIFKDAASIGSIVTHFNTLEILKHFNFEIIEEGPLPPEFQSKESKEKSRDFKYWFLMRKPQTIHIQKEPQVDQITDVTVGELIGAGGYGQVFKGLWHATPVACKSPESLV